MQIVSAARMFQSTRPTRGATIRTSLSSLSGCVSIHAPHAGRDAAESFLPTLLTGFQSTRPTRGATDALAKRTRADLFQSTRPTRGATCQGLQMLPPCSFNPRAPRGARHPQARQASLLRCFNPRAPRGARHHVLADVVKVGLCFNPRAPRGARRLNCNSFDFCVLPWELRGLSKKRE